MGVARGRGPGRAALPLVAGVALAAVAAPAGAARADAARPDWARGLVIATATGVADRHAPSPVIARGPARRAAEEAARKQLAAAVPALPLAEGGTLAGRLGDPAVKARVDRAVAAAITVAAEPGTDGSWKVTLGVPIEAIRQALTGPRPAGGGSPGGAPASDAEGPAVVVVEGARATPAVGYRIGAVAAPAIWVAQVPPWARDAPRVRARGARGGAIELADARGSESTLFVIVLSR